MAEVAPPRGRKELTSYIDTPGRCDRPQLDAIIENYLKNLGKLVIMLSSRKGLLYDS